MFGSAALHENDASLSDWPLSLIAVGAGKDAGHTEAIATSSNIIIVHSASSDSNGPAVVSHEQEKQLPELQMTCGCEKDSPANTGKRASRPNMRACFCHAECFHVETENGSAVAVFGYLALPDTSVPACPPKGARRQPGTDLPHLDSLVSLATHFQREIVKAKLCVLKEGRGGVFVRSHGSNLMLLAKMATKQTLESEQTDRELLFMAKVYMLKKRISSGSIRLPSASRHFRASLPPPKGARWQPGVGHTYLPHLDSLVSLATNFKGKMLQWTHVLKNGRGACLLGHMSLIQLLKLIESLLLDSLERCEGVSVPWDEGALLLRKQ